MELKITDLANNGLGISRQADGRVVMVRDALPGEEVLVELQSQHKGYALAQCQRVLTPSPQRVQPLCPWFGRCGGCSLQHLQYAAQTMAKRGWLATALRRLAPLPAIETIASPQTFDYRHRLRLHAHPAQPALFGFYAAGSHELVPVDDCRLAVKAARAALPLIKRLSVPGLEQVEILAGNEEGQPVFLSLSGHRLVATDLDLPGACPHWPEQKLDYAQGLLYYEKNGLSMRAQPGQFSQVNWEVNTALIDLLLNWARHYLAGPVLDLFAGSGNLSLPLARNGAEVWAVEAARPASAAGRFLARQQQLPCRFICQPVSAFLAQNKNLRPELIVLDPPHAGAKGLMPALLAMQPRAMAYISCHPAALARDAEDLRQAGYALERLALLDMFPQTGQMECLAFFSLT